MALTQLPSPYPIHSGLTEDGGLELGGCDAHELAREFGTPAYVVSEPDLRERARAFVAAFAAQTDSFEVHFATKAFPCSAVLRVMAEEGLSCDVAGGGELATALRAGFDPSAIHLHGNAKSRRELREALDAGVGHVVLDSDEDIARVQELTAPSARTSVQLRVAPGVSPETHPKISTGGPNTKFGFGLDAVAAAVARVRASDRLELEGLHVHIGSQVLELAPFRDAVATLAGLGAFRSINLGGGLGVPYLTTDRAPTIEAYAAAKVGAVQELLGDGVLIRDEPGRALVANSTVTLYTVESVKRNVDTYVAVDGGMSDNLRPMLYGARYEAQVVGRFGGGTRCHVVGKHCESGDVLVRDADLADPRPGDLLVTPATGAYGYAMANTYNGALRAPVIFVGGGDARLVVRRDTYDDLLARDVA